MFFSDLTEKSRYSGSVLLVVDNRSLFDASYGLADRSSGRPVRRDTQFQIASVRKQFTAAAILLLQEQGTLSVRDPLSKWIPDAPPEWTSITLHHLLTHSAGVPHWGDIPQLDLFHPVRWEAILAAFASRPLKFPPGNGYAYSSPGYHLLAKVVENATGDKYVDFLQRRIFIPLGMTRTAAGNRAADIEDIAMGYAGDQTAASFDLDTTSMGAGDVWSTPGDLFRWNQALSQPGTILNGASLAETFHPQVRIPEEEGPQTPGLTEVAYGYGWGLAKVGKVAVRYHDGRNSGYRSFNLWAPQDRITLCVLSNQDTTDVLEIVLRVMERVPGLSSRD